MALPVNIRDLINGRTVEWERIEFKRGWNPVPTMYSICAFANDFNDWGGGYIIIGIEDDGGRPVLQPVGVPLAKIDAIQKELLELCYKLRPHYIPIVDPVDFQDKKILIIRAPGGSNRPYKAPEKTVERICLHPIHQTLLRNQKSELRRGAGTPVNDKSDSFR